MAVKAVLLIFVSRDNLETYTSNYKQRMQIAKWVQLPIFGVMFILMNMRYTSTCYRYSLDPNIQDTFDLGTE